MNDETELGWLSLTDGSRLVLTPSYVLQHQDRGAFGEYRDMIPLAAVTSVRLSWRRSRLLLLLGVVLLIIFLALLASALIAGPGGQSLAERFLHLSGRAALLLRYGALAGALVAGAAFWFYKLNDVQIVAATGSVGGTPRHYFEADNFCSAVLSELKSPPAGAVNRPEPSHEPASGAKSPDPSKSPESDWQL
jgi:hypothetical protein